MAKSKKTVKDSDDLVPVHEVEVFDETVGVDDSVEIEPGDENVDQINEILMDPTKALKMEQVEAEENEEVLYCPNCGVTGLFVDNVCMNCGVKKSKTTTAIKDEEDIVDFEDNSMSMDEF